MGAADLVADPYPHFAAERARHEVAWHETGGTWLTFSHAAAGAVLRNRRLGRIWRDREPAAYLEPFNLLHRNQMMEHEPPEHTRPRRAGSLLDDVDPAGFDVADDVALRLGPAALRAHGDLGLVGEPESRGTFVLRGFRRVVVGVDGGRTVTEV